jgi:tripartite-type tricarboxylate transporter receptor subunit TctC
MRKNWCTGLILAIVAIALASPAGAASKFPTKPIILVNCMPAGGGDDRNSRAISSVAADYLGQPLIVQIKGGGSGSIAMRYIKNAKPDGYTLGTCDQGAGSLMPVAQNLPYSPKDYVGIARLADLAWVVVVRRDSGWNSIDDVIKAAKAKPGEIVFPIAGVMSADHYPWLLFANQAGIKGNWVNFGGGGPKLKALLGGESKVDFMLAPVIGSYVGEKGPLKAIAVSTGKELKAFPGIPTLKSMGYDIDVSIWISVIGPKGIPKDRLSFLRNAFGKMVKDKSYLSLLRNMRQASGYMPGEDFQKLWQEEYEGAKKIIAEVGGK